MANIDNYYRSAVTYTQSPPTTDTFSSSFNYSTAENLYGSNVLLYTGLIPTTNPLTSGDDGDKYAVDGIDIVEKVSVQALTAVDQSAFGFTDSRLTYLIPGSVYGITVWSKDQAGDYTVAVPPRYYDVFFYPQTGTYVIYFKDTSYEPMYRTADGLIGLQYAPAITCYRYCGPKGIENLAGGSGSQGPQGASGSAGPQGASGSAGPQGASGSAGPQGASGSAGPQGATGPAGGGGIAGTQYIYVAADGTATQNATELQTAYNTAKTMSPSSTNRITIVAAPGNYDFGLSAFTMDTQYIDLVSLDGNRSVVFNGTASEYSTLATISITANNVFVRGVDVGTKPFAITSNLNLLIVENCKGGQYSFGNYAVNLDNPVVVSGTFIDCVAEGFSFGGGPGSTATGTFISCTSNGIGSFGLAGASGVFTNCTGGTYSFGLSGAASGVFTNCTGGDYAFSGYDTAGVASGTFTNCTGGQYSFAGNSGDATGTFTNCTGGQYSFAGGGSGVLTGKLFYCRLTAGSFQTVSGSGITRLCLDGSNVENNQG